MIEFVNKNGCDNGGVIFNTTKLVSAGKFYLYLSSFKIDDGKENKTVVQVDLNGLTKFHKNGTWFRNEYNHQNSDRREPIITLVPDQEAIINWWTSLGCPLDARVEESDLTISYEEVGIALKSLPKGKLENFSNLYSYNKGVNSGTWGTNTTLEFIEGNDDEGVVELHTTGIHPRVNGPHVKVDFLRESKVSNGYLIPTKKFFEYILEKWNEAGRLTVSLDGGSEIYVKGRFTAFRPEIVKMIHEKVDFSTPSKIIEILQQVYGAGEETLFVENLISSWVRALSS